MKPEPPARSRLPIFSRPVRQLGLAVDRLDRMGRAQIVYLVMEGAVWLWDLADDRLAHAVKTLDFHHARDHLHYQEREKAGAPRGSGAAESLGKQLQQRLRGCGQCWIRPGLTHLLRLCVLFKNRDNPLLWN